MILYGAGGHAAVVYETLNAQGDTVQYCIDDDPDVTQLLGTQTLASSNLQDPEVIDRSRFQMIVSIGNADLRRKIVRQFPGPFGKAIHPSALVSPSASVGEGTVIFHLSVIQARAKIGSHVIVNTAANIDHDCVIGDYVHIAPNCTLCGGVTVGESAEIGAGTTVIPGVTIGEGAIVGAGTVVISDIPANTVAVGSPSRMVRRRTDV